MKKGASKKSGMRKIWNQRLIPCLFAAGGLGIYLLFPICIPQTRPVSPDGRILRDSYGGDEQEYQVLVDGLDVGTQEVTVKVSPRSYSKEEAEQVFSGIRDRLEELIRGGNPSLTEVTEKLELPSWLENEGIRLRWISSDPDIVGVDGTVYPVYGRAQEAVLQVQMSDGVHRAEYEVPVCVTAMESGAGKEQLDGLKFSIEEADKMQQESEYLQLPLLYEGKQIRYRTENTSDYGAFPVLGIVLAVLWVFREQTEQRKKEKSRENELLLDYSEVVSKLMVFIGAGMTVRNAWARMVSDYEAGLKQGKLGKRAVYEEMRQIGYQMANGMPESSAYQEFGRRCRLQPYLKLSSLLDQNRKAGNKNLRAILENELTDAFELRKNLARRLGEEAGTKLLLPLFLMLGVVMVMIMVPAMMTMG